MEYNNLKLEAIKPADIAVNNSRVNDDTINLSIKSGSNNDDNRDNNLDDLLNKYDKEEDIEDYNYNEEKIEKKEFDFYSSNKIQNNSIKTTSRKDFENIEKNIMKIMLLNILLKI